MDKIEGKWYGSCYECGHSFDVKREAGEPLVLCVPQNDLVPKYGQGCSYIIPRCSCVNLTDDDKAVLDGKKEKVRKTVRKPAAASKEDGGEVVG
jgi:hypothetical protein